jgi:hypothetical protein
MAIIVIVKIAMILITLSKECGTSQDQLATQEYLAMKTFL